jgi:flavin reductase (DIM6/NTAB) family NADH-FMN oxidoreductase RutF
MMDHSTFRSVLGRFPSGVIVLTARSGQGVDHGMTISAFSSVSLDPPLVMACVGHAASMHALLQQAEHVGVNILAQGQEEVSRRFAEVDGDRFEGQGFTRGECGVALLDGALAHLECRVHQRVPAGDHTLLLLRVERAIAHEQSPLLYYRSGYARLDR